jgi:5S rRNA maturation endonuclease (ribonuclease M5)
MKNTVKNWRSGSDSMTSIFCDVTRRLLNERLELIHKGFTPKWTDIRHFFYECRNVFLRENPKFDAPDVKGTPREIYSNWSGNIIPKFCKDHCEEFDIPKDRYWLLREKLNIWAAGRAVCEGEGGDFLVTPNKRERITKDCSFVLLCEKKTVSKELLEGLRKEGYKINLISTGGRTPNDIKEAVLKTVENMEEENFYFFMLHDFDTSGIMIYHQLKKHYNKLIDAGVNSNFIKFLKENGNFDFRLVKEQCLNKQYYAQLEEEIKNSNNYSDEDFKWLQGERISEKRWRGNRIEIDAIHVQYGVEPFVEYIKTMISLHCKCWDLTRIGFEEFDLEEPRNPFEDVLGDLNYNISLKHKEVWEKISEPLLTVDEFVKKTTSDFAKDFNSLKQKYNIVRKKNLVYNSPYMNSYTLESDKLKNLKEKYKDGFDRKYAPDYDNDLDELNEKVHNYCRDVLEAEEDLNKQHQKLQQQVNNSASDDYEATKFDEELNEIDWGEDEFDELKIPDEKEVLRHVIEKLQERLTKLEVTS